MLDRNEVETRAYERHESRLESEWELKLAEFRRDPFTYCAENLDAFGKTDLLDIALESILQDFDMDAAVEHKANQCAHKDMLAAITDSIWRIEL